MGAAFEVVTAFASPATTTAGTYIPLTPNSGQSFALRQANGSPAGRVLGPWAEFTAAGRLQVKSPRWHDTTIGDTYEVLADTNAYAVWPLLDLSDYEPGYATDVLTVQFTTYTSQASATNYAIGLPVYYNDLPGVDANFTTPQQIAGMVNPASKIGVHYVSWVTPSSAATAGQIGPGVLINSVNDQFKAQHSYALLGYTVSQPCAAVLIQGTDTGNLYVGGPGNGFNYLTKDWFLRLSRETGLPLVPVIQANNKGATSVFVVDAATTSTTFQVGLIWQDLGVLTAPAGV